MWKVSWQICVASLQESVRWVYRRFHRWCNHSWEDGGITLTKCTTNLCNMFFKKYSTSEKKKECNITLKWSFNMCKNLFKYSRPTSVNTADHFFKMHLFVQENPAVYTVDVWKPMVFFYCPISQDWSGFIWINPKPKEKKTKIWQLLWSLDQLPDLWF